MGTDSWPLRNVALIIRNNVAHDLGDGMDGDVEGRIGVGGTGPVHGAVAREVVPAGAALCLWL